MLNKILTLLLLIIASGVHAQEFNPPIFKADNIAVLKSYQESANGLAAKNLNRFAIERLYKYDLSLDSLYKIEKADSLKAIEQIYLNATASKQLQRSTSQRHIKTMTAEKDVLAGEYHSLLRKAALAFLVWVTIILLMIQFRKRKMKSSELATDNSEIQLKSIEERNGLFEGMLSQVEKLLDQAQHKLAKLQKEKASASGESVAAIEKMESAVIREKNILEAIKDQQAYAIEEKVSTNINQLCDTYMEIAQRGFAAAFPELNCQVTRDFEKKLPEIKVAPASVGNLVLNVLLNAFQSVEEKQRKNIKGYQPKISISTRILPRFLQIRIKDNGVGMTDEIQAKAMEEFYSTKLPEVAVGLGLSESSHVISTLHKGEIKIESEKENSTDVYLKFYL